VIAAFPTYGDSPEGALRAELVQIAGRWRVCVVDRDPAQPPGEYTHLDGGFPYGKNLLGLRSFAPGCPKITSLQSV